MALTKKGKQIRNKAIKKTLDKKIKKAKKNIGKGKRGK